MAQTLCYCAGMSDGPTVEIQGSAGWGLAESMLSGTIVVQGSAGNGAAASIRGGTVVIHGDAAARAGVSMKGGLLLIAGNCGYMAGFMGQKGTIIVYDDVKLAAKAGADVVVIDGMEGGTAASPEISQEHTGIPTLAAVCEARAALESMGLYGQVQIIIAGGIRHGPDAAKALALGADAVYIGTAALIALNCNKPIYVEDYAALGTAPYHCHHCHTGRCPVGVTTQDPELMNRPELEAGAERVANLLQAMALEIQMIARSCGKSNVHDLEPEDMRALTAAASMICDIPLAGTRRVFGGGPGWKELK